MSQSGLDFTEDQTLEKDHRRVKITRAGSGYRGNREGAEITVYKTEADNMVAGGLAVIVAAGPKEVFPWNTVEVVAAEGVQFGVVSNDGGKLVIAVKFPGGEWAGTEADIPKSGLNEIAEGASRYIVDQK